MEFPAEIQAAINALYEKHITGGPLHIVLDDGNLEDRDIKWCLERIGSEDEATQLLTRTIANWLLCMPVETREELYDSGELAPESGETGNGATVQLFGFPVVEVDHGFGPNYTPGMIQEHTITFSFNPDPNEDNQD